MPGAADNKTVIGRLKHAGKNAALAIVSPLPLNTNNKDADGGGEVPDADHAPEAKSPRLQFSELEVDRLKIAFDMHAEGDECVVYVERLGDLLKTLFIVPTKAELRSLTSAMDSDRTGKIDFGSFLYAVTAFIKPQYGEKMLNEAFYEISGGKDNIDVSSLQRTMINLGQSTIRPSDCRNMIREVDRTGGSFISKKDFLHYLQTCAIDNI